MTAYGTGRTMNDKTGIPAGASRRSALFGAAADAGALALGAGALAPTADGATFVKGADISWMPQVEANGYHWNNRSGQRKDRFTILKGCGITAISPPAAWMNVNYAYDTSKQVFPTTPAMVHLDNTRTTRSGYGKPVVHVEHGGPRDKANQVRDGLRQSITGQKGFGGLGTFFWEPEGCSPFTRYGSTAWDPGTRGPTAAMDGFLNV